MAASEIVDYRGVEGKNVKKITARYLLLNLSEREMRIGANRGLIFFFMFSATSHTVR